MEFNKNMPLYIQIKDDIYKKIETGEYADILPSEKELMKLYEVSRVTLRGALKLLEDEGIISRKAGFGTKINRQMSELKNFTTVKSFTNEMKENGAATTQTFSSSMSIVFDDNKMSDVFSISPNSKLYNLKRIRGAGDKAIVYSDTWLNLSIDLPMSKEFLFGSLYNYLIENNILFSRFEEELEAMMPTKELKEKLKLDKDVAILKRIRKGYDVNDNLIEYTINYYDANLYTYKVEVAQIEKVK